MPSGGKPRYELARQESSPLPDGRFSRLGIWQTRCLAPRASGIFANRDRIETFGRPDDERRRSLAFPSRNMERLEEIVQ